jgi:hypothetical protein
MMFAQRNTTACPFGLPGSARRVRSGVMLLEVLAGVVLLLAAIGLVVQILAGEAAAQRAIQHKLFAFELLTNIMEEQTALPFEAVTPQSLAQLKLPPEAQQLLPQATLTAAVVPSEGSIPGKRLTLELRWQERTGESSKPVRLIAWIYPLAAEAAVP